MEGHPTTAAVESLRAAVDGFLSAELDTLSGVEIMGLLEALEVQRRRWEAVDQRLLAEAEERRLAGDYARSSVEELLTARLRVSPTEAKARVARAQELGPRRALTGEPLQPILPGVAEAVRAGEISAAHVAVISDCLDDIPGVLAAEAGPVAEQLLVEAARHEHPRQLAKTGKLLLARLDPDGIPPREDEIERKRGFTLRQRADGSSDATGRLTADLTAMLNTVLDSLAAPVPAEEGMPDDRSPAQRRHDGLAEAMARLLRSASLPPAGGSPVTILARTTMQELVDGLGVAIGGHGEQFSISKLLEMSADAHVVPVVCNETGGVLAYGRGRRLADRGQRLGLAARDGGCCFPGCDRPAAWTEVHHIRDWIAGGETNIDEMCLLCRYHHREFAKRGWEIVMIDDVPHWLPPAWLDPDRRPIRNTAHHLTDFEFAAAA